TTLTEGGLLLGPLEGTISVDGQALTAANGLAVSGYSGPVTISESSTAADLVAFNGAADFFTLHLDPEESAAQPGQPVNLAIVVEANFNDVYTTTVAAPAGWITSVNEEGIVTATAPTGALPGEYQLLATVQSSLYPQLLLSAVHTVTVTEFEGVEIAVVEDDLITIPMGPIANTQVEYPSLHGHLVDGRAEIPGAAHTIIITNTSNIPYTFDLTVSGLPTGWTILSNAGQSNETSLTLGPGAVGQLGLYIDPTVADLLPAGESYNVNVTAVSQTNPTLTAEDNFTFTMPGLAFPYPQIAPDHQFVMVGEPVAIEVTMTNVGNVAGSFPVTLTMPTSIFNGTPLSPTLILSEPQWQTAVLSPQQSETQTAVLDTTSTMPGQTYFLKAHSIAGEYEPAVFAGVTVVSEIAGPIFIGAQQAATSCPLNEPALSAALGALALAVTDLEIGCDSGDCPLALRDQVVTAAQQAANYGRLASPLVQTYTELETAAAILANADNNTAILDALPGITTAVSTLITEICAISQHRPTLRLTPWLDAALPDQVVNYDLQLTNRGTMTTTYAVTVTLPGETLTFQQTVNPGATENTAVAASNSALGLYLLQAEVRALDASIDHLTAQAEARLNVVDRFIQVTAVTADPPFVETGESSTTLQVEIANIAGIGLSSGVETAVYAPDGSQQWSDSLPLTILGGAPRLYDLAEVDTSGWAAGVYTITADVQLQGIMTAGGSGYGYLSVGQAVIPSHAVQPDLVAPGTVTVTTSITTEINSQHSVNSEQYAVSSEQSRQYTIYDAPYWDVRERDERPLGSMEIEGAAEPTAAGEPPAPPVMDELVEDIMDAAEEIIRPLTFNADELSADQSPAIYDEPDETAAPLPLERLLFNDSDEAVTEELPIVGGSNANVVYDLHGLIRYEQNAMNFNGSWSTVNQAWTSGGQVARSVMAGNSASFTFDGTWVGIGFSANSAAGHAEIFLNGESQGIVDTYSRYNDVTAVYFDNLINGTHTISVTVTGERNPFATNHRVEIDYVDVWDGTPLPDGSFEENDERVYLSGGWSTINQAVASGGQYIRSNGNVNAWFPFTGDSVTFQAFAYNGASLAQIYIDGQSLGIFDLYSPTNITRTFSFDDLGPGAHVLQVSSYRGMATADRFVTPGEPPFYDPPIREGIIRYEEDDPALLYNGVPFGVTAESWNMIDYSWSSEGYGVWSDTAGDTVSLTFDGQWVSLGLISRNTAGFAEIFINGESQGIVDTYTRADDLITVAYDLTPGTHTISITVLNESNEFSSQQYVRLDYIDVWDGTLLPDGRFEETDERIYRAGSWTTVANANASDGSYIRSGNGSAWFHFEGDSFTYEAMAYNQGNAARLFINGQYLDTVDLYHTGNLANAITRTFSYEGFGPGPHVLEIRSYRGQLTLDALVTPGYGDFIDPNPPLTGISRLEEDHPAIRYNGLPIDVTATSWAFEDSGYSTHASDRQYARSMATGDTVSLEFEGGWIGVGMMTGSFGGHAEIAIDGQVMAEVDLYTRDADTTSVYFSDLGDGPHTITITVLADKHPNSSDNRFYLDYFDLWDGQPLGEGQFEETDERIFYSGGWGISANAGASGGAYATSGGSNSTAWFPFTGDSVTYQLWAHPTYHSVELKIDGVSLGHFQTFGRPADPRAYSFEGLGDGPHVLEVRQYRNNATVDAFITPSTGENYDIPAPSGVIRLEEDHPDLRYNGYPFRERQALWGVQGSLFAASGNYNANSTTAGATVSLEFEGPWVGAGFVGGGVVEIFIDGESRGTFNTAVPAGRGDITSVYFDDLITGTHTISITRVSGSFRLDYIDIWDGQPLEDGWYNATLHDFNGRFHYSNKQYISEYQNQYAYEGDFVRQNLINSNPNIWFTFVGDSLTLLTRNGNNAILHVTIDGDYKGEYNLTAEFSNQPYALHFPDLGDGPHSVQIHTRAWGIVDAFEVNPDGFYSYTPQIIWHDDSAKEQLDPAFHIGFLSSIAIGDLNGDGVVELVAPARNGRLYVYRGDGQDTGDGTPILWTSDLVGPAAEPALADLTGDGAAEIVVVGYYGTFAFRHDGVLLWEEDSIKSTYSDGGGIYGWGGPTIGNLDDDPHPEIVIAAYNDALYVLDHQGNILDSDPLSGGFVTVPVLADITGDGTLDIITAHGHTLKVYEYDPLNGLEIAWTYTLTNTTVRSGTYGAPAVADITGDGQPEIIINWGHRVEALTADGALLWSYDTQDTNRYRPSPVTVADVTGDGQMNLVTASAVHAGFFIWEHMIVVLTADGNLVWEAPVEDRTSSASGVAAQDLTGDGAWEILWNGSQDGFLILRGSDGKRLFNEPITASGTIIDYPALGDVDGDGVADVVTAGREGIFVISHVGHWINSRPLWNQHNYHVTNINDDWSVPLIQPNSWELHNTYRTQTPEQNPAPSYRVEITHTVGVSNVTVLTDTFSTIPGGTPPQYAWQYNLEWYAPVNTISFASELADMQPGETRQVNNGTEVSYRLPSGWNYLTLPPLYVTAGRIVEIAPETQGVGVGSTAVYTLTLLNPGLSDDLYSLDVLALPIAWLDYPAQVNVPAQSSVEVLLEVTAPAGAELTDWPFLVSVATGSGGQDMATASLTLFNGLEIAIDPPQRTAPTGTAVRYTLTLTNSQQLTVNGQLTTSGLA
ncbi:MAG: FG-GAP-like repeat-containing protein, partial [Chloroflexota bacterium]